MTLDFLNCAAAVHDCCFFHQVANVFISPFKVGNVAWGPALCDSLLQPASSGASRALQFTSDLASFSSLLLKDITKKQQKNTTKEIWPAVVGWARSLRWEWVCLTFSEACKTKKKVTGKSLLTETRLAYSFIEVSEMLHRAHSTVMCPFDPADVRYLCESHTEICFQQSKYVNCHLPLVLTPVPTAVPDKFQYLHFSMPSKCSRLNKGRMNRVQSSCFVLQRETVPHPQNIWSAVTWTQRNLKHLQAPSCNCQNAKCWG